MKDLNPTKRLVCVGMQDDAKYISREFKKAGFRELKAVHFDGQNIELTFSGELNYKPQKRVVQFSKKKNPDLKKAIKNLQQNETSAKPWTKPWTILETIEFPDKWLIFLV